MRVGRYDFRFCGITREPHLRFARLLRNRVWEQSVIEHVQKTLRPGDVFYDIGAYLGPYTLLASRLVGPTGRVLAFEPDAAVRSLLELHVEVNRTGNVTVFPFAVGDRDTLVPFVATGDSRSYVADHGDALVEQITLDTFVARTGLLPSVIKIDVEGGEAGALAKSRVARRTRELIVEVHDDVLRSNSVDATALFDSLGDHFVLARKDADNYWAVVVPRPDEEPEEQTG